ncbi:MAG: hypothetical protein CMJ18_23495 [Phycisphaeraceae bacterium]|nr:hypothetical protein [Phycisphaeraceae bacterium]
MTGLEFVDAHVHFWDLDHPDLHYSWLMPDGEDVHLGDRLEELKGSRYVVDDYIAETRAANVVKAIHLNAAIGSGDTVDETRWLQEAADRTGFPHAIVAGSNLKDPEVGRELERHCRFANMRGIRDFSDGDDLVHPDFHRGYGLLARLNLVASLSVSWPDMIRTRDLALKFPETPLVLDHCGEPMARDDAYFVDWRKGMTAIAEAKNVVCKISGLGMRDHDWTVVSIRRWVLTCIDIFGPARCIFGTNWPVDRLFSTYDALIDAYTGLVADFSETEQRAMFARNAEALYRI